MDLNVWRLHPQGCRVEKAEQTLRGTANKAAVQWCRPYTTANALGYWVYPPVDIDILWRGGDQFSHRPLQKYGDDDYHLVRNLLKPEDAAEPDQWSHPGGRTKFTWGVVEPGVVQIWTGCIFQTPPDWYLHVRSPINFPAEGYQVQEGVLETDWMWYDIWLNLTFTKKNAWQYLRRGRVIAQIVPVHKSVFEPAKLKESAVNRDTPEGEEVFKYWVDYNRKKFENGGKQRLSAENPALTKDSTTFFRERQKRRKD